MSEKKNLSVSELFTQRFLRDNHTCQDCGATERLEIHHILPISQGGKNELTNLKTVCFSCHRKNYREVHFPKDKSKIIPPEQRVKTRSGMDKSRKTQLLISVSDEMLEEIDNYRFENKCKNRSEAIRDILKLAIETDKQNNQNEKN